MPKTQRNITSQSDARRTLEAHYDPNRRIADSAGLSSYNCGYAAAAGDRSFAEHQRALVWRLLEGAPIHAGSTIVDVGCGIGGPAAWIMQRYQPARVVGIEFCWSSVLCAAHQPGLTPRRPVFLQGDAHRLPLADQSVDVLLCLESALHYADKHAFLAECRRVLRLGGALCLGDITTDRSFLLTPLRLLNRLPGSLNPSVHLWSSDQYRDAITAEGLTIARHEEASQAVARSLRDGLTELGERGWAANRGCRGRLIFLAGLERMLAGGRLQYDLFSVRRDL